MSPIVPGDRDSVETLIDEAGRRSGLSVVGPDEGPVVHEVTEAPPTSVSRPSGVSSSGVPSVLHPRGRITPPLPASESRGRRLLHAVVRLIQGVYHHDDIFHAAPAMAFHFFLSLLPLLVFLGYVLGLVAQSKGMSVVFKLVLQNVPSMSEAVLEKEVVDLAAADRLGPLAAVGFLWIASGGTQGLMQAIERVVGVPRRAWWRQRLIALAWVVGLIIAVPIASFGIVEWNEVVHPSNGGPVTSGSVGQPDVDRSKGQDIVRSGPTAPTDPGALKARRFLRSSGERLVAMGFSFLVAVGGLAAFYWFAVAYKHRVRRRVLPGALVAVGLIIVISWGFGLYVSTLASYTIYYGSLAAIAVLIVWLWLMSLAILIGAELNSQLEGLRDLDGDDGSHQNPT